MKRYQIDPELCARAQAIEALAPDVTGFRAMVELYKERKEISERSTLLDQVNSPAIGHLWWMVYTIDYRMVVLRAGIAYVGGGGKFSANGNDFRAMANDVFGKDGIPFNHELKGGSIYAESILREWQAAKDATVRNRHISRLFGSQS